jgi:hypothetical protein
MVSQADWEFALPNFWPFLGDVERDRVQMLRGGDELSSCMTNRMRKVR